VLKSASVWLRAVLHHAAYGNETGDLAQNKSLRSVVFISRRPIPGKSISRIMRNEDQVVAHLAKNLPPSMSLLDSLFICFFFFLSLLFVCFFVCLYVCFFVSLFYFAR
jgi:hypothetical protein